NRPFTLARLFLLSGLLIVTRNDRMLRDFLCSYAYCHGQQRGRNATSPSDNVHGCCSYQSGSSI
ncbi:hypothetical protein M3225_29085, partial [Priestia aryabhattai]|nr:hypothetical protein [Priestia aryabhattai]